MTDIVAGTSATSRFNATLFGSFAGMALVLASFLRQGLVLTVTGLGIGGAGALLVSRWLSSLLFGVRATDPSSFVVVTVLLLAVACIASYLPARRAAGIDPVVAMRGE
jgi:putative ABC transport system permease protein